ncbi:MAG: SH3 domain-containing protein [Agathobacter sp.]|nr:SH3 domain-containing protein [Agathobacter sp.]
MAKRVFMIMAVLCLLVGCGKTGEPDKEKDTQQTEQLDTEEDSTEAGSEVSGFTYTDLDTVMYTTAAVNVRALPNTDGEKLGGLAKTQEVQVTGQCKETGWYRIEYNGAIGYVSNEYLVDEMPSSWVKDLDAAKNTTQMIVVEGNGTHATVSMHTKNSDGVWIENFSAAGRIGWAGLGKQKEGDGKTPIGIYRFMAAFGIKENPGLSALPYLQVDESHHWVDDPTSKYYNQCVSTNDVEVDWSSSEHLYKYVPDYHYALALNYNEDCVPYVGCAIFLHCPTPTVGTTAGCIAIPEENMVQVMRLLRTDCIIIIDTEENITNY